MKKDESLRELVKLYNYVNEFTEVIELELKELNMRVFSLLNKKMNEKYNTSCESQNMED